MTVRVALSAVFGLVLGLFAVSASAAEDAAGLEGQAAPDVVLKTLDGKDIKLSDMKGKVVVMDFWATWCPPCRKSLPNIQKISQDKELAEKGLVVWAVNAREKEDTIKKYMDQNKFTFIVPMDPGASMQAYKVRGIPTTVVVGRDGKVAKIFVGFGGEASEKALDAAIKTALDAKG